MNLLGKILMWLVVAVFAIYLWPLAILVGVLAIACVLMSRGKTGPMNASGFKPLKSRPIWQADGYWYTTDGHISDPIVAGPFPYKRFAEGLAQGRDYLMDAEGLYSIEV